MSQTTAAVLTIRRINSRLHEVSTTRDSRRIRVKFLTTAGRDQHGMYSRTADMTVSTERRWKRVVSVIAQELVPADAGRQQQIPDSSDRSQMTHLFSKHQLSPEHGRNSDNLNKFPTPKYGTLEIRAHIADLSVAQSEVNNH